MRKRKKYYHPYEGRRKPLWLLALLAAVLACVLALPCCWARCCCGAHDQVRGDARRSWSILGCQVEPDGPSVLLQDRLDKALDYLEDHPDMTIVVSGGQGPDEPISEAQCMYDYLTAHGVDGGQILLEDRSHNTWENMRYTLELLQAEGVDPGEVLVVSNGFHLARVRMLWAGHGRGSTPCPPWPPPAATSPPG